MVHVLPCVFCQFMEKFVSLTNHLYSFWNSSATILILQHSSQRTPEKGPAELFFELQSEKVEQLVSTPGSSLQEKSAYMKTKKKKAWYVFSPSPNEISTGTHKVSEFMQLLSYFTSILTNIGRVFDTLRKLMHISNGTQTSEINFSGA